MTPRRSAADHSVGARHAVPVLRSPYTSLRCPLEDPTSPSPSRRKSAPTANLTPLNATLTLSAVNTVNKGLTKTLNPLDATFTRFPGGAFES
jgi:hypothetical protein